MMTGRMFTGRFHSRKAVASTGSKSFGASGATLVTSEGIRVSWSSGKIRGVGERTVSVVQMKSMMREEYVDMPVPTIADIEFSPGSKGKSIDTELAQLLQTAVDMKKLREAGAHAAAS